MLKSSSSVPTLPSITKTYSFTPSGAVPFPKEIFTKRWTTESKRLVYEQQCRMWLKMHDKPQYIDLSESERAELRSYFNALSECKEKISKNRLEDFLISLGLAEDREAVIKLIESLDGDLSGNLDFEEYLDIVRKRSGCGVSKGVPSGADMLPVFKAMVEGKLGDKNLNVQTNISCYRRSEILDYMCERKPRLREKEGKREKGDQILRNYAKLHQDRLADNERTGIKDPNILPFDKDKAGVAPMGGLEMLWRGVVTEHNLVSSRPASAAHGRSKIALDPPMSPRDVVSGVLKDTKVQPMRRAGTIIVREATVELKDPNRADSPKSRSLSGL